MDGAFGAGKDGKALDSVSATGMVAPGVKTQNHILVIGVAFVVYVGVLYQYFVSKPHAKVCDRIQQGMPVLKHVD